MPYLAVVVLVPFLTKAYTIDDPWFLLQARQILKTPLQPMSFAVCWWEMKRVRCAPARWERVQRRVYGIPLNSRGLVRWCGAARPFAANPSRLFGNPRNGKTHPRRWAKLRKPEWVAGARASQQREHRIHGVYIPN